MRHTIRKQLSLFLSNQPGMLNKVVATLAADRINILAITISDTVDHAVIRLVVDRPERALAILEERDVLVVETEVLVVSLANRPGALADLSGRFAAAGVNIEYAYGSTGGAGRHVLVFRLSDLKKGIRVLKKKA